MELFCALILRIAGRRKGDDGWPANLGADASARKRIVASNSSRNRSPLIVGFSSTTSGPRSRAEMLAHVGLITGDECQQIVRGLTDIRAEIEADRFEFVLEREDVHMHVEAALIDRLGDVGRKLHTARSRNDQVATDVKLWVRDGIDRVSARLVDLQRLVDAAERHRDVILPGYTHLRRLQPVLAPTTSWPTSRSSPAIAIAWPTPASGSTSCPWGRPHWPVPPVPIDREHVAQAGSASMGWPPTVCDVSSDRDFALESVFDLTLIAEHLSGWAEEWVLWSTQEFSFLALPDAICTGSSIMPQKKNPDVLELIRGRTARVIGALNTLLVLIKGLPLAYNRDLQEDKEPIFDAFDTVEACLELAAVVVGGGNPPGGSDRRAAR